VTEPVTEPADATRTRTLLFVGLGLALLAALVVFVILPLLSGDPETPEVDVNVGAQPEPTVEPTDDEFELAEPDKGGDPPAETFEVFNARDPFQQLVREAPAGGGGGGGGPGPGIPTDGASPSPGATLGPTPGPTVSPSPGATTSPQPDSDGDGTPDVDEDDDTDGDGDVDGDDEGGADVGGTTVTVVDVFTDDDGERKASVTVNGTGYTVGEGDEFAGRFRLLDISGRCATMLFGDSRFTLCEGERIRK
jgi:hypothetical protein